MTAPARPTFEPGRVDRTREFGQWSAIPPPRLAQRLVRDGHLVQLAHGLFEAPRSGRCGAVPPTDGALLRAFLDGDPYVFTGPERWNALGLGTTAVFALPLVYNTKRSGRFSFGGRQLLLRRVAFPATPSPEGECRVRRREPASDASPLAREHLAEPVDEELEQRLPVRRAGVPTGGRATSTLYPDVTPCCWPRRSGGFVRVPTSG